MCKLLKLLKGILNLVLDHGKAMFEEEQEDEINDSINDKTLTAYELLPGEQTVTSREFQSIK